MARMPSSAQPKCPVPSLVGPHAELTLWDRTQCSHFVRCCNKILSTTVNALGAFMDLSRAMSTLGESAAAGPAHRPG
jgi:hypothetical protein